MKCHLLIISCSNRKRYDPGVLPAIERYDGPCYRSIRKLLRNQQLTIAADIVILSAKHGLLYPSTLIENYDQEMSRETLQNLMPVVTRDLRQMLEDNHYDTIFINLGGRYLPLISSVLKDIEPKKVSIAAGPIGKRQQQMNNWLRSTGVSAKEENE